MGRLLTLLRKKGADFSPLDLPGLALWLDASDLSTITESGGAVSQWDDKSGNANHATQGTGAAQLTTGASTLNSLNVLKGTTATFMSAPWPTGSGAQTWFSVFVPDEAEDRFMLLSSNAGYAGLCFETLSTTLSNNFTVTGYFNNGAAFGGTLSNDLFVFYDKPSIARVDVASVSGSPTSFVTSSTTSTYEFFGVHAEILAFDRALTAAEIEQVEAYLAAKWGVTLA